MMIKMRFVSTARECRKNKVYKSWRFVSPGGHVVCQTARLWGGEGCTQGWACAFIGVEGGVPCVLQVHFLLVNLKYKGGN